MAEEKTASAEKRLRLKVLTPFVEVFNQLVDSVILKTIDGDMGVMFGHEHCSVQMQFSLEGLLRSLRIFVDQEELDPIMVMGGIVTVDGGTVTIMSDMAYHPKDFFEAVERRKAEKDVHLQKTREEELAVRRAQTSIRRALVQMDTSTFFILRQNWQKERQEEIVD